MDLEEGNRKTIGSLNAERAGPRAVKKTASPEKISRKTESGGYREERIGLRQERGAAIDNGKRSEKKRSRWQDNETR